MTDIVALISFVLITTFTPGPNNISSASMGVLHGYKNSLNYLFGITIGFFLMMLLSAWISVSLLMVFPTVEATLRLIGAGYILYLAWGSLKASYYFSTEDVQPMGFTKGLLLQLLNPKAIIYGLTLFSAFLAPIINNIMVLIIAAILLAFVAFCATSTWALLGTAIKTYLHRPRLKLAINVTLALLLVYTAFELSGLG